MTLTRRRMNASLLAIAGWGPGAFSGAAPARAASRPLLSVVGMISGADPDEGVTFDRGSLESLGMTAMSTRCPWYVDSVTFEGPLMRRVLEHVGAKGSTLLVEALNDYTTEVPIEDFRRFDVVLALKRDGAYMPVRDKGPLFLVYPYDSDPRLQAPVYYKRSAWQVARMIVK